MLLRPSVACDGTIQPSSWSCPLRFFTFPPRTTLGRGSRGTKGVIMIDEALAKRARAGRPIRTSLVGFGFMGRAIARQIALATPGMELASIVCRDLERARTAAHELGLDPGLCTVDPAAAVADSSLDAVLEATG